MAYYCSFTLLPPPPTAGWEAWDRPLTLAAAAGTPTDDYPEVPIGTHPPSTSPASALQATHPPCQAPCVMVRRGVRLPLSGYPENLH